MIFRSFTPREKGLLIALAAIHFTHIVDFVLMMPLGPQLMRAFDVDPHQFGMLVSSYSFAAGISGILGSFLMDRFDRKKSLLFLYGGFCLGTLACGLADTYLSLKIARIITGLFGGLMSSLIFVFVGDSIPVERRGAAMGIVMTAFAVASIFGIPASLFLAQKWGWHVPFVVLGLLSTVLWGISFRAVPSVAGHLQKELPPLKIKNVLQVIENRQQLMAITMMILLILGQFSIIPFISPSLVANAGLREDQLPQFYLIGGLVSIVASPTVGRLVDRFGARRILTIMGLLSILPFWIVTNLGPQPTWVIMTVGVAFFVVMSGRMVPAVTLMTGTVPPQKRGSFMSISAGIQQFASASASYLAGIIVTKSPDGRLLNYPRVGMMGVILTLVVVAFVNSSPFRSKVAVQH